jgi:hypothetical protein
MRVRHVRHAVNCQPGRLDSNEAVHSKGKVVRSTSGDGDDDDDDDDDAHVKWLVTRLREQDDHMLLLTTDEVIFLWIESAARLVHDNGDSHGTILPTVCTVLWRPRIVICM